MKEYMEDGLTSRCTTTVVLQQRWAHVKQCSRRATTDDGKFCSQHNPVRLARLRDDRAAQQYATHRARQRMQRALAINEILAALEDADLYALRVAVASTASGPSAIEKIRVILHRANDHIVHAGDL